MFPTRLLSVLATAYTVAAQHKGFNYGSTNPDGSFTSLDQFQNLFTTAQGLANSSGFTSARLYTMIAGGTIDTPTGAIQAAINTKTQLLLGLWASAGQDAFNNELMALSSAISLYGTAFTDLIVGICVGSEDLYRITPTGIENKAGAGAQPSEIVNYVQQTRNLISTTAASAKPVGHVDTWTAWVNGSNAAVVSACDFLGLDAYPYFQITMANSIQNARAEWNDAYQATIANSQGRHVWVTETGWPLSGPTSGQAVASVDNAKTYWDEVGCSLFGPVNTWYYTLYDGASSPSFGIVGSTLSTTPAFDLTCPADTPGAGNPGPMPTAALPKPSQPVQAPVSSVHLGNCPASLHGIWESPHLIIPVDVAQPNRVFGPSYFGVVNGSISTWFNFDLPASYDGLNCSFIFLFPTQEQLKTSSFNLSGTGGFSVMHSVYPITATTSFSSLRAIEMHDTVEKITPGNSYVLSTQKCHAGETVAYGIGAAVTGSLELSYFQDSDSLPIGAYISAC